MHKLIQALEYSTNLVEVLDHKWLLLGQPAQVGPLDPLALLQHVRLELKGHLDWLAAVGAKQAPNQQGLELGEQAPAEVEARLVGE